eukprot:GHRR01002293.1.p1 GENE.GHRR01002293.1~~GHRR01002293.1.p1  ORF type:complete len:303 (+),score=105.32 GHRR01002293.1:335-1243(+)
MAGATTAMMTQDAGSHLLATPNGTNGLPNASMPILQPVFIPRQTASKNSQQPVSPNGLGATASADWAFLLRSAAALSTAGNLAPTLDVVGSSPSMPDLAAGMRSSPQVQSSPSLLYSPITSTGPNSNFFSDNFAAVGHDTLAAQAAATDPNGFGMVSNGNNLASTLSAAAAMYGDNAGVQTLYSSSDQLAMAANAQAAAARQAAQQTQNILQQAAVNSLSNGLNGLNLAGLAGLGNGLGKLEESLSGSLFGAAGAPKPVSSSLYIKVRTNVPPAGPRPLVQVGSVSRQLSWQLAACTCSPPC